MNGGEARDAFSNNNVFRQASFRPKKGMEFEELIKASEGFRDTFGSDVSEVNASAIVSELRKEIVSHEDAVVSAHNTLIRHGLPGSAVLEDGIDPMRVILRGADDNAISTFNASHRSIKDAIKRAGELEKALSESTLRKISEAREALKVAWPFLRQETDVGDELRAKAMALEDILARETFYREMPSIDEHAAAIEAEYDGRYNDAIKARRAVYSQALDRLLQTPGWEKINDDLKRKLAAPLERGRTKDEERFSIPQIRSEIDACEARFRDAVSALYHEIDGERVATLQLDSYFAGGIETEEQLDAALDGIREECSRLIGNGKKVIVQ